MTWRSTPGFTAGPLALALVACGPSPRDGDELADASEGPLSPDLPDPSDTSSSASFVPPDPNDPPRCDPWLQDCPDGEKCVPWASTGGSFDATKCVPVLGDQPPGEPCTYAGVTEATDDCDAGSHCWNAIEIDGESIGTCHPFCTGTPDDRMCPPGSSCMISGSDDINLCLDICDPLAQDCDPGLGCYWFHVEFNCVLPTQDLAPGEPCGFVNDCAAGLVCISGEIVPACAGTSCCVPFCDLVLGDESCAVLPGTSCLALFEPDKAPAGHEDVGVCISP